MSLRSGELCENVVLCNSSNKTAALILSLLLPKKMRLKNLDNQKASHARSLAISFNLAPSGLFFHQLVYKI